MCDEKHCCILFATCLAKSGSHVFGDYDLYFCSSFEWTRLIYSYLNEQNSYYTQYNFLSIKYTIHYWVAIQSYIYGRDKEDGRMEEEMHCFHT